METETSGKLKLVFNLLSCLYIRLYMYRWLKGLELVFEGYLFADVH